MRRRLRAAWAALTGSEARERAGSGDPGRWPRADRLLSAALAERVADALVVTDPDLVVLEWNPAMERLTGLPGAAAVGRALRGLSPILDELDLPGHLRRALGGEATLTAEVPDRRPGAGGARWIEGRCVPLRDRSGRILAAAAFLTDTTDQRQRALVVRAMEAIGRSLTSSLDLDEVLDIIVSRAREAMAADSALVVAWEAGAPRMRVMRAAGRLSEQYVAAGWLPMAGGPASRAIRERRPVTTGDVLADPRFWLPPERRAQIEREGFKAVAAAPLASKGRVHGALLVHYWTARSFGDEEVLTLSLLAEQAAIAIDNASLYAGATRRAARLRELAAVSQTITASLEAPDIMQRVARAAAAVTPGVVAVLHVLGDDQALRYAAHSGGEGERGAEPGPADAALPGLVLETRAPVLLTDPARHPRCRAPAWWQARPGAAYYGVPIVAGDALLGVLGYIFPDGTPDAEEQEILRLLAAYAGIAIRNASLYHAERTQARRLAALAAINQRISSSLDLDDVLRRIAESAAALAGVSYARFWVADEERRTLTLKGGSAPGVAEEVAQPVVGYEWGGVGWIARHRRPLLIDDVASDERILNRAWWQQHGMAAYAGFPVVAGDELLAVLVLAHADPIRFDPETRGVIDMFIAQAGVAIRNARLYQEAQRRREVAEALARVGRELTGTLDLEPIAELVARRVVELLGGRAAAVYRHEAADGTLHVIGVCGSEAAVERGTTLGPGEGVAGWAVAERRLVLTGDILHEPAVRLSEPLRQRIQASGQRAIVGVPLLARGQIVGALAMAAEVGRVFSGDELQVLQAFADQAALALQNARLYAAAQDSLARLRDTQAQLVHVAKMSALGQLVSGVAHELNNPLSVIIGYGQLLLQRSVPEPLRRPLELMVDQADRMGKIVRNLLYFARQRPPERSPVDLNQVIEQALALRLNQLTLSRIVVERDFAPLPPVSADAQQLQQVFLNLVLNAEQAIADAGRGGRIVFRTRVGEGGGVVRAQVIDDGPGIPPDVLPRIFEPFFTTKEVGSGTGLGLSVSYGIVEEHGGRLSATSAPGETVFTLELPVGAPAAPERPPAGRAVAPPFAAAGHTALVVEDEPGVADLVVGLLRDTGWRVDLASGGREGLERVRRRSYDLVVSDLRMPDGDGEEFYREAVRHEPALAGRFLFITGDTARTGGWESLRAARVPVLEKPFAPDRFLDAVRRIAAAVTVSGSRP